MYSIIFYCNTASLQQIDHKLWPWYCFYLDCARFTCKFNNIFRKAKFILQRVWLFHILSLPLQSIWKIWGCLLTVMRRWIVHSILGCSITKMPTSPSIYKRMPHIVRMGWEWTNQLACLSKLQLILFNPRAWSANAWRALLYCDFFAILPLNPFAYS